MTNIKKWNIETFQKSPLNQDILYVDGWRASFKIIYFWLKTLMALL